MAFINEMLNTFEASVPRTHIPCVAIFGFLRFPLKFK